LLPPDVPAPYYPFLASIDCASLPAEATDLSLPRDGRLLLFAFAQDEYSMDGGGSALYVPSGADVEERKEKHGSIDFVNPEAQEQMRGIIDQYPLGELHPDDQRLPALVHRYGGPRPFLRHAGRRASLRRGTG
jgi:hypothetical protein